DDGPRDRAPEATPELANALTEDGQARDGQGRPDSTEARDQGREQNEARPEPGAPDVPKPDASAELRSAIADSPKPDRDTEAGPSGPDSGQPGPAPDAPGQQEQEAGGGRVDGQLGDRPDDVTPPMESSSQEDSPASGKGADPAADEGTGVDEGVGVDGDAGTDKPSSGWDDETVADHPSRPDPDSIRITPDRAEHILDGDKWGGGHRAGTGKPEKTEFPADWDDKRTLSNVEDVARNPDKAPEFQGNGKWLAEGVRDDVHITAIVKPDGSIVTAWPREGDPGVIKNP
ncbi:MAG: EndoU domain-containing protein, partial [Candidatus Aminicenantales bacterium]